ncbi:hypothetical protein Q787_05745 [Ornithobacterium rhinotracheale H06-030791]|nr:hypothetical protein Q785_06370 [Ornithobacterium rhinotracheale ORT-UMN 88]KGB66425.1 hypothetical protein Q787_07915 [Ornithobacterium rhinotracheale H06-030791]KGB66724.1 hypothetical protein Q787_07080 [Ornithobacterium rhinotracheale H06-030791]KGB67503.1 hypothetical protein Q787_05745 [Ornithobacterium rhinotracheale H06-030791]
MPNIAKQKDKKKETTPTKVQSLSLLSKQTN